MSIYQEHILDHYHNPRHRGLLEYPTHRSSAKNISCGDSLFVDISERAGIIETIGWEGDGCAISQASASLLAEHVLGKSIDDAMRIKPEDISTLLGIELSPSRIKCALLSLETLHKALRNKID